MNSPVPQPASAQQPSPASPAPSTQSAVAPISATPPSISPPSKDPLLSTSIDDAYILLDFSCRQGKTTPAQLSDILIKSRQKQDADAPLSSEEETSFWNAFAKITEQIKPVTVESIRFTRSFNPTDSFHQKRNFFARIFKTRGPAERVLRNYLAMAAFTLLMLLALQVEWAIGTFIYNDAFKVHHNLLRGQHELVIAQQLSNSVQGTAAAEQADAQLKQAQTNAQQDQSWNAVSFVRLWWWNREVSSYIPPFDLVINEQTGVVSNNIARESGVTLDEGGRRRLEYTRTELTLQIISNYFLVTLFALLGALTQALRAISQKIQDVSLTANDLYRVRTRVILGVISGVCMAWLFIISTPNSDAQPSNRTPLDAINFFGSFTPWAVAFISGYSVEIFFSLLERIITIITIKIKGLNAPMQSAPQHKDDASLAPVSAPAQTPPPAPPGPGPGPAPAPKST